ncbi:hypothetical protein GCM10027217_18860 [Pseudomaricurvus hydrocarbonicus]
MAEEMNKCRKQINNQARQLCRDGWTVLVPDYHGTGDSSGEFVDVRWSHWRQQMLDILDWVSVQGASEIALIGVRLGALLALEVLSASQHRTVIEKVVLWQPVVSGKLWLNQFLRLRVAAGLMQTDKSQKETPSMLRQQLRNGQIVEVAGYALSPDLADDLEALALADVRPSGDVAVFWLEVSSQTKATVLPASSHQLESWKALGVSVHTDVVTGDAFWSTQEIAVADKLIEATSHCLSEQSVTANDTLSTGHGASAIATTAPVAERVTSGQQQMHSELMDLANNMERTQRYVIDESRGSRAAHDATMTKTALTSRADIGGLKEQAFGFECSGSKLIAILHNPPEVSSELPPEVPSNKVAGDPTPTRGILIVVGGPQYRVGSHRQFLQLSRQLAESGVPVMRFDYRGMGDSEGEFLGFESVGDDIRSAIDNYQIQFPQLKEVILWGLCDGATAAACYASTDPRVTGLILLNPWVRTEAGQAKAYLKHYYWQRLTQPDLWRKILSGKFDLKASAVSLGHSLKKLSKQAEGTGASVVVGDTAVSAPGRHDKTTGGSHKAGNAQSQSIAKRPKQSGSVLEAGTSNDNLIDKLASGLNLFNGPVLLVLSGSDLTAAEFKEAARTTRSLKKTLSAKQTSVQHLDAADHTFSRQDWKQQVTNITQTWLQSW